MRTTGNATFFETPSTFEKLWLRVNGDNNLSNEALIAFGDQATDGYDDLFDAKKIAANTDISLYTTAGEMNFSIQAMSALTDSKIVPVGFDATQSGIYTFSIANIEGINPTVLIYLEDRELGTFNNLRAGNYNADITGAISGEGRFFLHFSKPVQVSAAAESCSSNDGSITIENANNWNYSVVNSANQVVAQGAGSVESSIDNLVADSYVITLSTNDGYNTIITTLVEASSPVSLSVQGDENTSVNMEATFAAVQTGATSITWDFGDGSAAAAGSVVNHVFMTPGIYTVTAFASNESCSSQSSFEVRVEADVTGINHIGNSNFKLFPNPANNSVTVVSSGNADIQISDITGKTLRTIAASNSVIANIETADLSNGIYLVTITENGLRSTQRLVISH